MANKEVLMICDTSSNKFLKILREYLSEGRDVTVRDPKLNPSKWGSALGDQLVLYDEGDVVSDAENIFGDKKTRKMLSKHLSEKRMTHNWVKVDGKWGWVRKVSKK
jgi:hypothetical protein